MCRGNPLLICLHYSNGVCTSQPCPPLNKVCLVILQYCNKIEGTSRENYLNVIARSVDPNNLHKPQCLTSLFHECFSLHNSMDKAIAYKLPLLPFSSQDERHHTTLYSKLYPQRPFPKILWLSAGIFLWLYGSLSAGWSANIPPHSCFIQEFYSIRTIITPRTLLFQDLIVRRNCKPRTQIRCALWCRATDSSRTFWFWLQLF